jgi:hypothetical protein
LFSVLVAFNIWFQEYHTTLCDTLGALGYTQTLITLQQLHEEFDRKVMYGVFSMIVPAAVMLSKPGCGLDFDDMFMRGVIPGPSIYSDNYKKAVKWMLPVLDLQGAFREK